MSAAESDATVEAFVALFGDNGFAREAARWSEERRREEAREMAVLDRLRHARLRGEWEPLPFPTPGYARQRRYVKEFDRWVYQVVCRDERRAEFAITGEVLASAYFDTGVELQRLERRLATTECVDRASGWGARSELMIFNPAPRPRTGVTNHDETNEDGRLR